MMSLSDMLKRADDAAIAESTLESQLSESLEQEISGIRHENSEAAARTSTEFDSAQNKPAAQGDGDVLSARSQGIMAAYHVFNDASRASRDELATIGKALTSIISTQNIGREFLNLCETEILRASELEQANHRLVSENRKIVERAEKLLAIRERQNENLEAMRRRETRLLQDCDQLRETVTELRNELIEFRNNNVTAENQRSEMHIQLASKTAEAERTARETDVLRDKISALTNDLELVQKRQGDTRRKLDELQATHTDEINRNTELTGRLVATEKELLRLQKHNDTTDVLLRESSETLQNSERELADRDRRHESEIAAFKNEVDQLNGRLQKALHIQSQQLGQVAQMGEAPVDASKMAIRRPIRPPVKLAQAAL